MCPEAAIDLSFHSQAERVSNLITNYIWKNVQKMYLQTFFLNV